MSNFLFEIDDNPAPSGIKTGHISVPANKNLRYALLRTDVQPFKGTVILLQGRNEYIEKYFETMNDLTARGFDIATFDWRGQGGSTRLLKDPLRGYVRRFKEYDKDLEQFLTDVVLPDCRPPFYILAHSMGALIAMHCMPQLTSRISRMVLCAPLLGLRNRRFSDDNARRISSGLCLLGLGSRYAAEGPHLNMRRAFADNPLTSDPVRFARNQKIAHSAPEISLGGPTFSWLRNVLVAIEQINHPEYFGKAAIPTLILASTADPLISQSAIERFVSRTRNFSLVSIDGARHELLQEADYYREQALAAFDAFIPGSSDTEIAPQMLEPEPA